MSFGYALVSLVAAQRLAELVVARGNARRLLAEGGVEAGARHYPLFVALHAAWLATMAALVPPDQVPAGEPVAALALLMLARIWVMLSLGPYWTTRVITLPGAPLVRSGPYRLLRHPNYLVVCGEIAVLPLAFDLWEVAVVFSLLNGALLAHRIRIEDAALADRRCPDGLTARGTTAAAG